MQYKILGDFGTFMKWFVSWPLLFLMFITIPNCNNPKFEKFFIVTFVMSTVWIAAFSYVMVWMVCMIGFTLGIPDTIMGITFLAAGTSVPDTIASVMVARNGYGDMAVSNSIGSNVFDILLGLGLPWFLSTTIRPNGGDATVSKENGSFFQKMDTAESKLFSFSSMDAKTPILCEHKILLRYRCFRFLG